MNIVIVISGILNAFTECVGTRVMNAAKFLEALEKAVQGTDFETQPTPGQAVIRLPEEALDSVTCGVGFRTKDPNDYVVRVHHKEVGLFLHRKLAIPAQSLAVIVYTQAAYLDDPEVRDMPGEMERVAESSHVLVAVLADVGESPQRSPVRFTAALGGENREFSWLAHPVLGAGLNRAKIDVSWVKKAQALREQAMAITAYDREYAVVAD